MRKRKRDPVIIAVESRDEHLSSPRQARPFVMIGGFDSDYLEYVKDRIRNWRTEQCLLSQKFLVIVDLSGSFDRRNCSKCAGTIDA